MVTKVTIIAHTSAVGVWHLPNQPTPVAVVTKYTTTPLMHAVVAKSHQNKAGIPGAVELSPTTTTLNFVAVEKSIPNTMVSLVVLAMYITL